MGLTHAEVRPLVCESFRRVFEREPNRSEAQHAHAVAELETSCGDGWKLDEHDAANNFGAIQKGSWTGATFRHRDSRPLDDGTSEWYETEFRAYPTPADGIEDLIKVVYRNRGRDRAVLPYATEGDTKQVSTGLYTTVYYQGHGRTAQDRIGHHLKAMTGALNRIARELGEPLPDGSDPAREPARVIFWRPRNLMTGADVAFVQRVIRAKPDGVFGPMSDLALKQWQREHKLKPDGKWGPVCQSVLETEVVTDDDAVPDTLRDPRV